MDIVQLEVGLLQNFCEVLVCSQSRVAALIDPAFEVDRLLRVASERDATVTDIFLTHTHDDHVAGLDEAVAATQARVWCHPYEVARVAARGVAANSVEDGASIAIGGCTLQAIFTPGHTPGCICWYAPVPGALFTGDVLFVGACGNVTHGDSNVQDMWHSLQRLAALPETTRMYPGHDYGETPTSTLAWELERNPAFQARTLQAFRQYKGVGAG